jgi:hypothetical protein
MPSVHIVRVAASALLKVPEQALEQRLVASPVIVGEELARQVDAYVREHKLGYFPALDYFVRTDAAIEPDVMEALQGVAWFVTNVVRHDVVRRLRGAFSHVALKDVRLVAFTMPGVRPSSPNALHELTQHYTPDRAKVSLEVSTIEKRPNIEGIERLAGSKIVRWLEGHFEHVEITSTQAL